MDIKDIQPRQGNVDLTAEVVSISKIREFTKHGKSGRVANARIRDKTGETTMTLWNEQVDKVKPGDVIQVAGAYANEWQGEIQITTGKYGNFEVLEKQKSLAPEVKPEPLTPKDDHGSKILTVDERTEEEVLDNTTPPPNVQDTVPKQTADDEEVTHDELEEAEILEGKFPTPSKSSSETSDEYLEEDIQIEEEKVD